MLQDDGHASDEQAKAIRTAVCSEGRELVLRYIRFQKATAESNGRQNAGNLENDEGHIFAVEGAATRPGDTCLLLPAGYVQRYPLARNEYPEAERRRLRDAYRRVIAAPGADAAPFQARDDFARATVARLEREKKRKVRLSLATAPAPAPHSRWRLSSSNPKATACWRASSSPDRSRSPSSTFLPIAENEEAGGGCWRVDDGEPAESGRDECARRAGAAG